MVQVVSKTTTIPGLDDFLREQPFMSLRPSRGEFLFIEGDFHFIAESAGLPRLEGSYNLCISVPPNFPKDLPTVTEIGGKIPRAGLHHVNRNDGTLCLGSPMRLMAKLQEEPTLQGFSKNCIVPYLYAMTATLQYDRRFPFGELPHGTPGELADYQTLLNLNSKTEVPHAINCILKKKRIANKLRCPCECGRRLGVCHFNQTIKSFRRLIPKRWLKAKFHQLLSELSRLPIPPGHSSNTQKAVS